MKCLVCKRTVRPGEPVVEARMVIANEKRGDFLSSTGGKESTLLIHVTHLVNPEVKDGDRG